MKDIFLHSLKLTYLNSHLLSFLGVRYIAVERFELPSLPRISTRSKQNGRPELCQGRDSRCQQSRGFFGFVSFVKRG